MASISASLTRGTGWAAHRVPRSLHPMAWWLWALGLAVAASRTTNPLLLGAVIGVVTWVVLARRGDNPWASAFRLYALAAVVVVAMRVFFQIVFGGGQGGHVLVSLPQANGRDAAAAQAKKARDGRLRRVGILDSSRYASLHPGYYVVFQGVYDDEAEASSALQRARAVFPSAYQREIVP